MKGEKEKERKSEGKKKRKEKESSLGRNESNLFVLYKIALVPAYLA